MNAGDQLIAEGVRRGVAQGEAKGLRGAIVTALSVRGLPPSDGARAKLQGCTDVATLTRWLERAVTASSEDEVFASD